MERFTVAIRDWSKAVEAVEGKSKNGMMYPLGAHFLEASSLCGQLCASH